MYTKETIEKLVAESKVIRRRVIESMGVGVAGHIGGSFSSADVVTALYFYKMKYDPKNPKMPERDRFLLSKGHVAILQYAAMAEAGFFPVEDLKHSKEIGFYLQGHPDRLKTAGIEAGTGSLGQGLSIGLGMALALKMDKSASKVYVLVGDGEIDEGQIWEAAMAAGAYGTDNLVAIVDNNSIQATGPIAERLNYGKVGEKFAAFGWNVIEIDGHDMEQIVQALDAADETKGQPTVIVAHTIKGKGADFAENSAAYHNAALNQEQYDSLIEKFS